MMCFKKEKCRQELMKDQSGAESCMVPGGTVGELESGGGVAGAL